MIRQLVACEFRKMMHVKSLIALVAIMCVLTGFTILSPADFPGGPFFMMSGSRPDVVGGAIGFIGNVVDTQNVSGSAMRTSFVYTPFWLPVIIVFTASFFASDFSSGSIRVSKAKGTSMGGILVAKTVAISAICGVLYGFSCLVSFVYKTDQYGATLLNADYYLFAAILLTNILLLCLLATQVVFLYTITRSTMASSLILVIAQVYVLIDYPSVYSEIGKGASENILYLLSPAYYLMNTSSLCFEGPSLFQSFAFTIVLTGLMLGASYGVLNSREL